ncbi:MAG: nitrite/sulfite reductase [Pseudomonadota bacterium]
MYQYDDTDRALLKQRLDQFRDQTERFLAGDIPADEYQQLRLRNGVYLQRHAPMLRVAIPYGTFTSEQMRALARVADEYDRGFGHMTTRQNMQFNWIPLERIPDALEELAEHGMHAIQTSGSCIRNITTDPLAGAVADETEDPRPWCELMRQWSTFHPEFNWLPRKFKIALSGAEADRAAIEVHDIGLRLRHDAAGESIFDVWVGGGLGRTPHVGKVIREGVPGAELLRYLEAVLRVYNRHGRRDNKYKARIKILVNALTIDVFREQVDAEYEQTRQFVQRIEPADIERVRAMFATALPREDVVAAAPVEVPRTFEVWRKQNTRAHRTPGYRVVLISLKNPKLPAGDITAAQMRGVAALADELTGGDIRSTHDQNLVLADVPERALFSLWQRLGELDLAIANIGTLADMIVCPGLDFCSLANATSISIWDQINERIDDIDYLHDLGDVKVRISGCMNACGHHHVADIGILGVDKKGVEWYQLTLGGRSQRGARIGQRLGRAVAKADVAEAVQRILDTYTAERQGEESFVDTLDRIGMEPFQERVYATAA